jgi:outer membrane protein assembly factor BamA
VITASNGTLVDMYRRRGHWRAAFDPPSAATGDCPGVTVTLNVKEGPAYAWDHAEWTGNAVLTPGALDALLAMKAGDVADATRIDAGLRQVSEAYGKQGYILEHARSEPKLDEAQRRATFQFQVNEGPQFRMGTLEFAGITESDAETLAKKWQLKPGDVFDASYMKRYQVEVISPLQTRSGARGSVRPDLDVERRVVSVKIVFK